ncbi:MAG: CHAT domain-containing protein [Prochlorothrix sp.]
MQESLLAQGQPEAALEASERGRARAFVELMARRQGAMALGQLQQVDPPTVDQMRRLAQEQRATLVEYSWVGDRLLIWVIQPDGVVTLRTQGLQNLTAPDRPNTPANGNPGGQNRGGNGLESLIQQLRDSLNPGTNAFGLQSESNRDSNRDSNPNTSQNPSQNPSRSGNARDRLERIRQQAQAGQQRDLYLAEAYNILIAPIADLLPPDPDDLVIIVPHRSLFLVPFAALPTPNGDRLIQHHTLSLAPSLQALSLSQPTPHPFNPQQALIVGNPTMPSLPPALEAAPLTLQSLPGAEAEAQTIGQLLGVRPLLGAEATEATVVDRLPQASLVHLATHGLLDELEALDLAVPGAIALAPNVPYAGDLPRPDGLLTASEILDLRLQADLVVLSACNTGRGTLTEDGVIGLSRSLLAAGTPSVLVSLWAVPDAPTATLMVAFYQALQNQPPNTPAPKARALRQAMLTTAAETPNPQDWAAFLLMGSAQ